MKKIILVWLLSVTFSAQAVNEKFFNQVILTNADASVEAGMRLIDAIHTKDMPTIKTRFTDLVVAWKKVEAAYILGDMNGRYLDEPRYLDIFHSGNEDIKVQLDLILDGEDEFPDALYKHSHKSINALEYILFKKDINNPRVQAMALTMGRNINTYLAEILESYRANKRLFLQSEKYASAILLNRLVASTYKLKEWRIGDVAGLSKKYKNKPDNRRAEYVLSGNSMAAILAILHTHQQMIDSPDYKDFGDMAREFGAKKEMDTTIQQLEKSLQIAQTMSDADFVTEKGEALYASTSELMQSYYIALMDRLGFVSKILDADGD